MRPNLKKIFLIFALSLPLLFGHGVTPFSPTEAQANNGVKALRACMANCRARAKACYASGQTGSCKNQQISCFAACQSSINKGPKKGKRQ